MEGVDGVGLFMMMVVWRQPFITMGIRPPLVIRLDVSMLFKTMLLTMGVRSASDVRLDVCLLLKTMDVE